MKKVLLAAVAALVCSAGFAQGTAAGGTATKEEITGQKSGSAKVASDRAEMKVDAKKGNMPMAMSGSGHTMMEMDANGDGMISRREYDNYHTAMWKSMKQNKGMVSKADMETARKGGPN